ncbi:4-hydroxy-tetrahydrodipicolinate synthase [Muricoccus radiodurans]|uniref:4-hydroxy-tetrahydrodipicolinate synthase n=1 Tax=Muricoccus radiodurans TaxID=2231721 RepID=UPI003CEF8251
MSPLPSGLRGSVPALVTPFLPGDPGALDETALARLAERAIAGGSTAVVVCGTTGEAPMLRPAEACRALRVVVEAVGGRAAVVAGIGLPGTEAAAEAAGAAERCGADALLVSAPPYVRPGQEGLRAHVRAVAAASGLPVVLYDVPSRTAVGFADETVARLVEDGAIAALKDATGDLARPPRLRALCGAGLRQLSGDDATAVAHLAMGGAGCVSVTANVVPALCTAVQDAWSLRDSARVEALRDRLAPLHRALFAETNPGPVKAALGLLGLCDPTPRLPLTLAAATTRALLAHLLQALRGPEAAEAGAMLVHPVRVAAE